MINRKQSSRNSFDQKHFIKLTKRRFRKKFGRKITATQINKIWKDFVQHGIIDKLVDGDNVKIDKYSSIRVVGKPILDDKMYMSLLTQGLMVNNGRVQPAELKGKRKDEKYKIVYKNTLAKNRIVFKASLGMRTQVRNALNNTNTYFHIEENVNKQTSISK